jgi:hypothetical protein
MGRLTSSSGGRLKKTSVDLSSAEGLASYAKSLGLDEQVNKITAKPKLSTLGRLGKLVGSFGTGEAVATGLEKGFGAGLLKYGEGIVKGLGSAITGTDYEGTRRGYSDIAEKYGIENGIAKFGLGFIGDVLLDPTTYFGGAIAKGLGMATNGAAKIGIKGLEKVSPEVAENAIKLGDSLQDALGKAFVSGYKTTEGLRNKVLGITGRANLAKAKVAEEQFSKLGTGLLTPDQNAEVFIRTLGGKRLEQSIRETARVAGENVARAAGKSERLIKEAGEEAIKKSAISAGAKAQAEALKGATGQVKTTVEAIQARATEVGQEMFGDSFYRSYVPSIKKSKIEKLLADLDRSGLQIGSAGYTKKFRNLLTDDELEKNLANLFFTVDSKIATNKIIGEGLNDIVTNAGKPLGAFKDADEAMKAGYKMLRTQGTFGKDLGWVNNWDWDFITGQLGEGYKTIDMLAKATGFDAVTSLFKRSVTGLFAPFHIRNYVSGLIQNYEVLGSSAFKPENIASGQKLALATFGKVKLDSNNKLYKLLEPFIERFKASSFYTNEFNASIAAGETLDDYAKWFSKSAIKKGIKSLGLSQDSPHFRLARNVGNYIEMQQKATAYVTAVGQGRTIEQALDLAEKAGFDYRALTKFESSVLRRIVPFYSFTRKNIELQLKTLGENPQRINQIIKLVENIGDKPTDEEKAGLPGYIQEGFAIKLPDTVSGLKQYITSLGTPIEQFAGLFKKNTIMGLISQMNPVVKVPIELGIGKDTFRQKDLKDVYDAKEYKFAPQIIKDLLQMKPVEKNTYKKVGDKLMKTGSYTQYVADPERLLIARALFTSRGVSYLDQVFNNDLKGFAKFMNLFTGVKAKEFDIELGAALKDKDQRRALEDLVTKYSDTKIFQKLYQSK